MFNVRITEYPTGYQVKVYDNLFGADDERKVVKERFSWDDCNENYWRGCPYDWEELDSLLEEQKEECLRVSFARTKKSIYYLARSNVWEWFVTLTLNPDRIDRYDYDDCRKKVRKWFNNIKHRVAPNMYYLVVPEMHKDGAWHFHALLGGCSGLVFSDSGKVDKSGNKIYNLSDFKYGFSTATEVKDTNRVSGYICKYITKDMCNVIAGRQRYWVSKNINRAVEYDVVVPWHKLEDFKTGLYENMTWKKKAFTEFFDVEYFEVTKDWKGVDFINGDRE